MIILEKYQLLEKLVGLKPFGGRESIVLPIIYVVTFISFNLMQLIFITVNIQEHVVQALTALGIFFGVMPAMLTHMYLLINRTRYYSLLNEMQDVVNERTLTVIFEADLHRKYLLPGFHLQYAIILQD